MKEPNNSLGTTESKTSHVIQTRQPINGDTLVSKLGLILEDQREYERLLAQRGDLAQALLDFLQTLYDSSGVLPTLRSKILSAMIRLSKKTGLYPNCLVLKGVTKVGDHPVAAGGFGEIWQGVIGDQMACLKVIKIYGDSDIQQLLKEFFKEAIVWRQLDHPNVLPFLGLYFLDTSRQRVCLLSPWMDNGNLRQFLKNHSEEFVDHARLVYDIASGLSYLHEEKIVHGDLKGDNIMITLAGRAAIADFGLARKVAESDILRIMSLSTSNYGKGSTRWMAPECLLPPGSHPSFRSDIYAFGGVCYETFTGCIPFYEIPQDITVVLQLIAGERPSRPLNNSYLNDSMWSIMQECWSREPSARPLASILPTKIAYTFSQDMEPAGHWNDHLTSCLRESILCPELGFHLVEAFLLDSQSMAPHDNQHFSHISMESQISLPTESASFSDFSQQNLDPLQIGMVWTQESQEALPLEEDADQQTTIHDLILEEEQYIGEIDILESMFIHPICSADPPIINPVELNNFINNVFGDILDVRECNKFFLEALHIQAKHPRTHSTRNFFLKAITKIVSAYQKYFKNYLQAEDRLKQESEVNVQFRIFVEQYSQGTQHLGLNLFHYLNQSLEHLQKQQFLLQTFSQSMVPGKSDMSPLIDAISGLRSMVRLRMFQLEGAMRNSNLIRWKWHDLVDKETKNRLEEWSIKRQLIIFELIKGEMLYVKDLEDIETMYINPLRKARSPIVPPDQLNLFIEDVFYNFTELLTHHRHLIKKLHDIQRKEHPVIHSITTVIFDAILNVWDVYTKYIYNYPTAVYRLNDEKAKNRRFKAFIDAFDHSSACSLSFINRPIQHLLQYGILLRNILNETPLDHEDQKELPRILENMKILEDGIQPGLITAQRKQELLLYSSNIIVSKPGEWVDLHLFDTNRSLIHTGELFRFHSSLEWSEIFVLLFDNCLIMTKAKKKGGGIQYHGKHRPLLLDLLTLSDFTSSPKQINLNNSQGSPPKTNGHIVYPCAIRYQGRNGGQYTLYAKSSEIRTEWKKKLEEMLELRRVTQEKNRVFEVETLSKCFVSEDDAAVPVGSWSHGNAFEVNATCVVPFSTSDGQLLVAIGCTDGLWIRIGHDPECKCRVIEYYFAFANGSAAVRMYRVLALKKVTQCAVLKDYGILLVLADKTLYAYRIESLIPRSSEGKRTISTPEQLGGYNEVQYFSAGVVHGRTFVIHVKKKGHNNIIRAIEAVQKERPEAHTTSTGSRFGIRRTNSKSLFNSFKDFEIASELHDLMFFMDRVVIMCANGFQIVDLMNLESEIIPRQENPLYAQLVDRRDSVKPLGMIRVTDEEFLLCYTEFGIYINSHGDPSRTIASVEWEGTAERVAFHGSYVLLFDSCFIEIRQIHTGYLVQIIRGKNISCLWNGMSIHSSAGNKDQKIARENRVYGVMTEIDSVSERPFQRIFELVPLDSRKL